MLYNYKMYLHYQHDQTIVSSLSLFEIILSHLDTPIVVNHIATGLFFDRYEKIFSCVSFEKMHMTSFMKMHGVFYPY